LKYPPASKNAGGFSEPVLMALIVRFFFLFAAVLSLPSAAQNSELSSYKLGSGDTISIRVLGEEDLKRERVRLSDAGTISFPVLGEIRVKGMTVGALEDFITKGLKGRYLLNPQVTIAIDEYRNFFVNGMVEKPGGYQFSPGLTVRKAISIAGGFKERASREKISIIRDDDPNQTPKKADLNATVNPGDIVTIEESFF
jgi:protein involved in polysaccharide export with SLBB domain